MGDLIGPSDFDWPIWGAGPPKSVGDAPFGLLGRLGEGLLGEESWTGSWWGLLRKEKKEEVRAWDCDGGGMVRGWLLSFGLSCACGGAEESLDGGRA